MGRVCLSVVGGGAGDLLHCMFLSGSRLHTNCCTASWTAICVRAWPLALRRRLCAHGGGGAEAGARAGLPRHDPPLVRAGRPCHGDPVQGLRPEQVPGHKSWPPALTYAHLLLRAPAAKPMHAFMRAPTHLTHSASRCYGRGGLRICAGGHPPAARSLPLPATRARPPPLVQGAHTPAYATPWLTCTHARARALPDAFPAAFAPAAAAPRITTLPAGTSSLLWRWTPSALCWWTST